jgi:site-specific recombinase XerC
MRGRRKLDGEEMRRVLEGFEGVYAARDRAMYVVGLETGFRAQELLSLRVGDVWTGERVLETVTVRREMMKGKKAGRMVYLSETARRALGEWIGGMESLGCVCKPASALFQGRVGVGRAIRYRQALKIIQGAAERAGVRGSIGMHSMRKTFAGSFYEASGRDLLKTQAALGHASVASTQAYLETCDEEIAMVMRQGVLR